MEAGQVPALQGPYILVEGRSVYKYVVKYVAKITLPQLFLFLNLAPGVQSLF